MDKLRRVGMGIVLLLIITLIFFSGCVLSSCPECQDPDSQPEPEPESEETIDELLSGRVFYSADDSDHEDFLMFKEDGRFIRMGFYKKRPFLGNLGDFSMSETSTGCDVVFENTHSSVDFFAWAPMAVQTEKRFLEYFESPQGRAIINLYSLDEVGERYELEYSYGEYDDFSYLYGTWHCSDYGCDYEVGISEFDADGEIFDFKGAVFKCVWKEYFLSTSHRYKDRSTVFVSEYDNPAYDWRMDFYITEVWNFERGEYELEDPPRDLTDKFTRVSSDELEYAISSSSATFIRGANPEIGF